MHTRSRHDPTIGRINSTAHFDHDWRVHEFTSDFIVEDVWALPITGGRNDFQRLLKDFLGDSAHQTPDTFAVRALWSIRTRLGRLLRWDSEDSSSAQAASLRARLPGDLQSGPRGPQSAHSPFSPLYLLEDEFAAELINRTVHGVLHLSWVPDGEVFRGRMAVLVKPQGRLGHAYMAAIKPFRYLIVYPAMLRKLERRAPEL